MGQTGRYATGGPANSGGPQPVAVPAMALNRTCGRAIFFRRVSAGRMAFLPEVEALEVLDATCVRPVILHATKVAVVGIEASVPWAARVRVEA